MPRNLTRRDPVLSGEPHRATCRPIQLMMKPARSRPLHLALVLTFTLATAFAATFTAAAADAPAAGWNPKPGLPAHPAIPPEFWATSPYRDFYNTRKNWDASGVMGFVEYQPNLPRILIIGDSISMGYTLELRQMFAGRANVYRIPGNGGDCTRFLTNYAKYLGAGTNWDLILFNWGLHDLVRQNPADKTYDSAFPPRFTVTEYSNHLEQCVALLEATGAHLVWASTTPVPPAAAGRIAGDEVTRNATAAAIMREHAITTADLYSLISHGPNYHAGPGNVHYTGTGYQVLAKKIAEVIGQKLGVTAQTVSAPAPAAKLINHWRFDNSFADEIAHADGHPADPAAFAFAPGQLSPCLYSKNTGTARTVNFGTQAGGLTNLSVTLWFKAENLEHAATLIGKTGAAAADIGWHISLRPLKNQTNAAGQHDRGGIWFALGNATRKPHLVRYDRPAFTVGQWHHLAVTFDHATGTAELYLDGTQLTRETGIAQSPADLVSELRLGANPGGFKGWVDDLQIWDGVLTASQIKEMVNQEGG